MQINPYLTFDGDCEVAFTHYQRCLGGTLSALVRYSEMPGCEQLPAESLSRIMHARLDVDGQVLMGSDSHPEYPYENIRGCSVSLNVNSTQEAERVFDALAQNGKVQMPLEKTFWAACFGMLVDQFGVPWMVNCEKDEKDE